MARALAGGFDAPAISPVLRATYTTSPQQTMQLLAAAFAPAVVQPAIMLHALAVAPFTPVQVVGPFTAAYPNPGWTATDLGSALVQAGFLPAIDAASLAESLRAATFDAGQALAALRALFPADVDTDEKAAALLRAAGYDLPAGAGEYTTTTEWWGDYFSPLVVDVAGGITIAGTSVDARRDPNTGTVTFDWTDIKTTRASGSITFVTRAGKQVFFGWIRPRPQDGPVSFTGEGRPAPVRWAGTYAVATKWGGSAGQWRPAGNLGVDPAGGVSIDSHTIAAPVWTGAAVSWAGEDNPFRAEIEFRDGCDDPYYFPEPVHGPCFVGRQQSGSAGWVDFRGVVVQG
jgi:hypothetical protein